MMLQRAAARGRLSEIAPTPQNLEIDQLFKREGFNGLYFCLFYLYFPCYLSSFFNEKIVLKQYLIV